MDLKDVLEKARRRTDLKYEECDECETIAKDLFRRFPVPLTHAAEAHIKFLKKLSDKSHYLGKCSRTTGKWAYLTGYDYVIEVWGDWWDSAQPQEREALLFHELYHIVKGETAQGKVKWGLRRHDVEEFHEVARIYGAWDSSLKHFEEQLRRHDDKRSEGEEHTD